MIILPSRLLAKQAQVGLQTFQKVVNKKRSFAAKVACAKSMFGSKNTARNPVFRQVRETLKDMCSGICRCCYCEDSCADEVEHMQPKNLYPELAFVWDNYVYACGPCNGPKNDHFSVIDASTGRLVDVSPKRGTPMTPPCAGQPAFINPRKENPLDFMQLDLLGTFQFVPVFPRGTVEFIKAVATIQILNLRREVLRQSRGNAFQLYMALLSKYAEKSKAGASKSQLDSIQNAIRRAPHATVWQEIKRQHKDHSEIQSLFAEIPHALKW